MKYTYGLIICTFDGSDRVDTLLKSIEKCPDLSKFSPKLIVEDFVPDTKRDIALNWFKWQRTGKENHEALVEVQKRNPDWILYSMGTWSNMQGTAHRGISECNADFCWYMSDDIIIRGNPFKQVINWCENVSKDIIDNTAIINPKIYDREDLVRAGFLEDSIPSQIQRKFYDNPFGTWVPAEPVQLKLGQMPSVSMNANGASFIVKKDAFNKVGGISTTWDVLDQSLSYKMYLNTDKIIYSLPTDPIYHCGGCAQNSGWKDIREAAAYNRKEDRCKEIFGMSLQEVDKKVYELAIARTQIWQEKISQEYMKLPNNFWRFL